MIQDHRVTPHGERRANGDQNAVALAKDRVDPHERQHHGDQRKASQRHFRSRVHQLAECERRQVQAGRVGLDAALQRSKGVAPVGVANQGVGIELIEPEVFLEQVRGIGGHQLQADETGKAQCKHEGFSKRHPRGRRKRVSEHTASACRPKRRRRVCAGTGRVWRVRPCVVTDCQSCVIPIRRLTVGRARG